MNIIILFSKLVLYFLFGLCFLENLFLILVPSGLDLQVRFSFCNSNGHLVDFWFLGCFLLLKFGCWKPLEENSLVELLKKKI